MNTKQKAFSLIELMIVIAIIGILAAIAIPSYQTYVKKSKISRVVQALSSYENEIATHFTETGQLPFDLSNFTGAVPAYAGGPLFASGDVVQVIWYPIESPVNSSLKGFLGARLTNELGGGMISLVPLGYADGSMTFSCGFWDPGLIYAADSLQYMPVGCNEAAQENL